MPFPGGKLVYDFKLDDGGVSIMDYGDELDEEERKRSAAKVIPAREKNKLQ